MKSNFRTWTAVYTLVAVLFSVSGCNLFGGVDSADDLDATLSDAQAKMDAGDCADAVTLLKSFTVSRDSRFYQMLGWAQLCTAGASVNRVGKNLFGYDTTSNNLKIVGDLANGLVPMTSTKQGYIDEAIANFRRQDDTNDSRLNLALGYLVKASSYVAIQAPSGASQVFRANIASTACLNQSCTAGSSCTAGMSDAHANAMGSALADAAAVVPSALGSVANLARQLALVSSTTAGNLNRCTIYNSMLTE